MPLSNDVSVNVSKFDPSAVPAAQAELNKQLSAAFQSVPRWYQVGAPVYRKMRSEGKARGPAEHSNISAPSMTAGNLSHPMLMPSPSVDRNAEAHHPRPWQRYHHPLS